MYFSSKGSYQPPLIPLKNSGLKAGYFFGGGGLAFGGSGFYLETGGPKNLKDVIIQGFGRRPNLGSG